MLARGFGRLGCLLRVSRVLRRLGRFGRVLDDGGVVVGRLGRRGVLGGLDRLDRRASDLWRARSGVDDGRRVNRLGCGVWWRLSGSDSARTVYSYVSTAAK